MNADRISIRKIKLKNLAEFSRSTIGHPAFGNLAPISLLRAESQSKNPQGEPDDIALLLALHENRCVGYHGLLPGWLKYKDCISKIYWLVTFYLDAAFRGKGYGKLMVAEIQNTNVDLVTTGITPAAAGVYRSSGFRQLGELPFYQLRPENHNVIRAVLQNLKPVAKKFTSKSVTRLSEKDWPAAIHRISAACFLRNIKTINWMISNPWVVSRQDARQDVNHYYFSRVRDLFKFIPLEIFSSDGAVRRGYLILSISCHKNRSTLKVLDYYFCDPQDIYIAAYYALKYAAEYGAIRMEFPTVLEAFLAKHIPAPLRLKKKKRLCLFYPQSSESPLAKLVDKITLNYCDSDTAFT